LEPGIRAVAVGSGSSRVLVTQFVTPFVSATTDSGKVYDLAASPFALTRTMTLGFENTGDSEISGRGAANYLTDVSISPDGGFAWVAAKKDNTARGQRR